MEKETLETLHRQNMSTHKIAEILHCSQSNVVYWMEKFGIETTVVSKYLLAKRVCPRCKTEKAKEEFYSRRGAEYSSSYCKSCTNDQSLERQHQLKKMAVEYKGGSCIKCGYNKCLSALDFHHINDNEKDFNIGQIKCVNLNDKVKKELNKCILVCANCHREIHNEIDTINRTNHIVIPHIVTPA